MPVTPFASTTSHAPSSAPQKGRHIVVAEDDSAMRSSLSDLLEAAGWQVTAVARASLVAEQIALHAPDVILSDVMMPGMTGLELLASLDLDQAPPLVLISAHGDIPTAVQAMTDGAFSFVEKPYEPRRLLAVLDRAAEHHHMRQENSQLRNQLRRLSGLEQMLLGQSDSIVALRHDLRILGEADCPVLLLGETGTGKELAARCLHDLSPNADGPFVGLNCATLSPDTFDADMIGSLEQPGRLFAAQGGTLFLDEIASCPLPVQAQLLRVLDGRCVLPRGSLEPVRINFRLLAATNADIQEAVKNGRLRQDLLFRLNTGQLTLPPLRARPEDLLLLAMHFLAQFGAHYSADVPDLSTTDIASLMAHDWPGNVRELRAVCERRILAARRGAGSMAAAMLDASPDTAMPLPLREALATFERELIARALRHHDGRMEAAAQALGIGRRTLNEKIVKLDLNKEAVLASGESPEA